VENFEKPLFNPIFFLFFEQIYVCKYFPFGLSCRLGSFVVFSKKAYDEYHWRKVVSSPDGSSSPSPTQTSNQSEKEEPNARWKYNAAVGVNHSFPIR
jgi:hypothetical protein